MEGEKSQGSADFASRSSASERRAHHSRRENLYQRRKVLELPRRAGNERRQTIHLPVGPRPFRADFERRLGLSLARYGFYHGHIQVWTRCNGYFPDHEHGSERRCHAFFSRQPDRVTALGHLVLYSEPFRLQRPLAPKKAPDSGAGEGRPRRSEFEDAHL